MPTPEDEPPIDSPSPSAQDQDQTAPQAHAATQENEGQSDGQDQQVGPIQVFEARVEIDPTPGGKKFQGVWLVRADGARWVIAYRPLEIWRPFEGKQVKVEGALYEPFGQSIGAPHFRVDRMTVDPESMASLVRVERERLLTGHFENETMEEGTKLAGQHFLTYSAEGVRYLLANAPPDPPTPGAKVRVRAREVELSPFAAHLIGPTLWILDISPAP